MLELLRSKVENRNIVILGFGREGQSTYALFRKTLPEQEITIADGDEKIKEHPLFQNDRHIQFKTGNNYLDQLNQFDLIFKTPGITLKNLDYRIPREKITSQTDLFLQRYSQQVIAVTGTKGKSTTATLIFHILKHAGKPVILLGNIGKPAFGCIETIETETIIVFELSSHQLEYITKAPHIAILLNLYQEHLDAYHSYEEYQLAKMNISLFQQKSDFFIFSPDELLIARHVNSMRLKRQFKLFSMKNAVDNGCFYRDNIIYYSENGVANKMLDLSKKLKLQGDHNLKNIMAAINACKIADLDNMSIEEGIRSFRGLEHRLEYAGRFRGIDFYNDSIATIPEATMEAIRTLDQVDTLILGGFDRGIDYSVLAVFLASSGVTNFIFTGEAGKRIRNEVEKRNVPGKKLFSIDHFDEFASVAFQHTREGMICLLSPAAASYDEFPNFEIRGKRFKDLVTSFK